ncbi:DUF4330 family protein [Halostella litorea]|uniref:DUF4330 family protein n=1 Tax=Halostella litorea TaxID=2528831 RepID=UPI001092268F|nr:DUF4330 family protein [Halostella litorea]
MPDILDRRGRLFGTVNVVDLLVLLLVFAVAAAGLTLVLPNPLPAVAGVGVALVLVAALVHWLFDPRADIDERATYVDLRVDRDAVSPLTDLTAGTAVVADGLGTLDLTDAYVPPGDADEIRLRAGELDPYDPSLPTPRSDLTGEEVDVRVAGAETTARVDAVADAPEFAMASRPVLVRADVTRPVAEELAAGQTCPPDVRPHAEIESVTRYGTTEADGVRVFLGVALRGPATDGGEPWLGDDELYPDDPLTLRTGTVRLRGEVARRDASAEPGEPTTVTADLEASLTPAQLDHVTPGLVETDDGGAEVLTVEESGAHETDEHTLTATLPVRECRDHLRFKGRPLRIGEDVALDFGTVRVEATVRDVTEEHDAPPAESTAEERTEPKTEPTSE